LKDKNIGLIAESIVKIKTLDISKTLISSAGFKILLEQNAAGDLQTLNASKNMLYGSNFSEICNFLSFNVSL